jgi:hypothetical protein
MILRISLQDAKPSSTLFEKNCGGQGLCEVTHGHLNTKEDSELMLSDARAIG